MSEPGLNNAGAKTVKSDEKDRNGMSDDWTIHQRKLELAKDTYSEVLDATKHQDDKVGRYLAALAFLTTGAIALVFRTGILSTQFKFEGNFPFHPNLPLIALSALGFFACVLLAVGLLLLCLSTPLRVPGQRRDRSTSGNSLRNSRLFFNYIGGEPVNEWKARWADSTGDVQQEVTNQYIAEAHNLAERARSKYQHTNEAAALFVFGLVFLGLAVALTTLASLRPNAPIVVDRQVSYVVAFVCAIYCGAILHSQLVYERQSTQYAVDAEAGDSEAMARRSATRALGFLVWATPLALLAAAWPDDDRSTRAWFCAGVLCFLVTAFVVTRARWQSSCNLCNLRARAFMGLGLLAAAIGFLLGGPFQVAMLMVYPCFLFLSSVSESSRRHRISQYRLLATRPRGHGATCELFEPDQTSSKTA